MSHNSPIWSHTPYPSLPLFPCHIATTFFLRSPLCIFQSFFFFFVFATSSTTILYPPTAPFLFQKHNLTLKSSRLFTLTLLLLLLLLLSIIYNRCNTSMFHNLLQIIKITYFSLHGDTCRTYLAWSINILDNSHGCIITLSWFT